MFFAITLAAAFAAFFSLCVSRAAVMFMSNGVFTRGTFLPSGVSPFLAPLPPTSPGLPPSLESDPDGGSASVPCFFRFFAGVASSSVAPSAASVALSVVGASVATVPPTATALP